MAAPAGELATAMRIELRAAVAHGAHTVGHRVHRRGCREVVVGGRNGANTSRFAHRRCIMVLWQRFPHAEMQASLRMHTRPRRAHAHEWFVVDGPGRAVRTGTPLARPGSDKSLGTPMPQDKHALRSARHIAQPTNSSTCVCTRAHTGTSGAVCVGWHAIRGCHTELVLRAVAHVDAPRTHWTPPQCRAPPPPSAARECVAAVRVARRVVVT